MYPETSDELYSERGRQKNGQMNICPKNLSTSLTRKNYIKLN